MSTPITPTSNTQRRSSFEKPKNESSDNINNNDDTNMLDNEQEIEQEEVPLMERIRLQTKKILHTSVFGHTYRNIMLVLSVFSAFQFVYQTYLDPTTKLDAVI